VWQDIGRGKKMRKLTCMGKAVVMYYFLFVCFDGDYSLSQQREAP